MTQQHTPRQASTWFKLPHHAVTTMLICSAMLGATSVWAIDPTVKELRIGFQKSSINFAIAKQQKLYEKEFPNAKISWNEFPAGPQILEALAVGSIDVGVTGDTPPVYAQAANKPLYYIAYEAAKPSACAILIPKDSKITKLSELKGKRIALQKGSSAHYLLVQAVRKAGLQWTDIQPIWLTPADARAAFQKGAVDAWVIWDPFFAAAEHQIHARVIATGEHLVSNHQFYLADRKFAEQHPDLLKAVVNELNTTTQWVSQHQADAAKLLEKPTGLPLDVLNTSISRMGFGVQPISNQVTKEQQYVADAFYQQKLIPNKINIQAAILAN